MEGRLEKIFVILWGWGHRGKGDCSRFSAIEFGMRLGELDLRSRRKDEDLSSVYLLPRQECPLGSQGVPVGVGAREKATNQGREIRREKSVGSTGDMNMGWGHRRLP